MALQLHQNTAQRSNAMQWHSIVEFIDALPKAVQAVPAATPSAASGFAVGTAGTAYPVGNTGITFEASKNV